MKKGIGILILVSLIAVIGYSMLYNGFTKPESITIQEFEQPFGEGIITTNKKEIATTIGILNRANKITGQNFELAHQPTYKIRLNYKKGQNEILHIYENFDKNTTLLISIEDRYYKINNKKTKKILDILLN